MSIGFKIEDGVLLKYEGTDSVVIIPDGIEKSAKKLFAVIKPSLKVLCPTR